MASDPFSNHHKQVAREAEAKKAADDIVARDNRVAAKEKALKAPKREDKGYPMPKPIWSSYGH